MNIFQATQKGPLKMPGYIDRDDTTKARIWWGAPELMSNTVYRLGDIIRPSVDNGYYYECTSNGRSGLTEPSFGKSAVAVGTATFQPVPWDLFLFPGEVITSSTWSQSDATVVLTDEQIDGESTLVTFGPLPADLVTFEVTNQITKATGESLSRTLRFTIREQ